MLFHRYTHRILELWRYGQAAILNSGFGYLCYTFFVWVGAGIYLAQLIAHIMGVAFNYFTYSRHVFRGSEPAKFRFVLAYVVNYALSVGLLAALDPLIESPYLLGFVVIALAAAINFLALKFVVFRLKSV